MTGQPAGDSDKVADRPPPQDDIDALVAEVARSRSLVAMPFSAGPRSGTASTPNNLEPHGHATGLVTSA